MDSKGVLEKMNIDGFSEIGEIKGMAEGIEWQNGEVSKEKLIEVAKRIQKLSDKVAEALRNNLKRKQNV